MDNYSIILALIGSVTSLLVAAIGFFAAVRAAEIAAERETARAFALKRHDAILEAAKILLDRANLYQQMLQTTDVGMNPTESVPRVQMFAALADKLTRHMDLDRVVLGVVPYVGNIPTTDYDQQADLSKILAFVQLCRDVNLAMNQRRAVDPTPLELAALTEGLRTIREPIAHECKRAQLQSGFLCERLKDGIIHVA